MGMVIFICDPPPPWTRIRCSPDGILMQFSYLEARSMLRAGWMVGDSQPAVFVDGGRVCVPTSFSNAAWYDDLRIRSEAWPRSALTREPLD